MEFLLELLGGILELIVEGLCELGASKKVPRVLRIIVTAVLVLFYMGITGILLIMGISEIRDSETAVGVIFLLVSVLLTAFSIHIIRRCIISFRGRR
ncbi:MAG: hypothetical protein J1F02_10920 [Lachnospiraceae bacterium]|nr:hypothetical protein [Lachnospiraceae bacterium]